MAVLSRRKLATYIADQLLAGKKDAIKQLAAYLVDAGRMKEAELIVRDIESALMARGVVVADVASAHSLSAKTTKALESFVKQSTGAKTVELRSIVDEQLLGGVKVAVPGAEMDATLRRKLMTLKASKV
jgi:F-type H+-transporting ATPase subunit delta